jgi:hypothetical protein
MIFANKFRHIWERCKLKKGLTSVEPFFILYAERNKESNMLIKKHQIVKLKGYPRLGIVLEVTENDIKKGINADTHGLYVFSGMWYGRDKFKIKSFGKIHDLDEIEFIVHDSCHYVKNKILK